MKARLIFLALLSALLIAGAVHYIRKPAPPKLTPAEWVDQVHKDVAAPKPAEETNERQTPKPKKRALRRKPAHVAAPLRAAPRKHVGQDQPEPQQGRICIFPLNMVPHCTPGVNDDARRD